MMWSHNIPTEEIGEIAEQLYASTSDSERQEGIFQMLALGVLTLSRIAVSLEKIYAMAEKETNNAS